MFGERPWILGLNSDSGNHTNSAGQVDGRSMVVDQGVFDYVFTYHLMCDQLQPTINHSWAFLVVLVEEYLICPTGFLGTMVFGYFRIAVFRYQKLGYTDPRSDFSFGRVSKTSNLV